MRYSDSTETVPPAHDAGAWAGQAAEVQADWFVRSSGLHGVSHTQRVHLHARRLIRTLRWPEADANVVLSAALWHDIGRVDDGWDPRHGALSVERVMKLSLDAPLREADVRLALFAIRCHCRNDRRGALRAAGQDDPERALRILRLPKDADALDRVRLGDGAWEVDSTTLRHGRTVEMIDFAVRLLDALP